MARAFKSALQALGSWVLSTKSRMEKMANGQGTPGTRAAPTQFGNNDRKIGSRLDNGETTLRRLGGASTG
ncbi:hypothetical protein EV356DRAFT_495929, partial [Viridothelium virens]